MSNLEAEKTSPTFSFVLPILNEQETIPELHRRMTVLLSSLDGSSEVILVDDGSTDNSPAMLTELVDTDHRFKVIRLSRNFGHQIAITAGIDFSRGDAVVIMDADLQDPPEVVLAMIGKWREGYEVVYAIREKRDGESFAKKMTASIYYRLLHMLTEINIPADVGDFRLVDRRAVDAFKAFRENNRLVRGMFSWIGFKQVGVVYHRPERYAGSTKYPFRKMLKLAKDGIISFSNLPLRFVMNLGFSVSALSFLAGIWALTLKLTGAYTVSGWTSMVVIMSFLMGIQFIVLGVVGEYVARIHDEVKNRPLYIVRNLHGFDGQTLAPERAVVTGTHGG